MSSNGLWFNVLGVIYLAETEPIVQPYIHERTADESLQG